MLELRNAHLARVDTVRVQPLPVFGEVGSHRADQDRPQAEQRHAECDIGADATAVNAQLVDEE